MLNEDIITSLNNAVVRGESLQNAVQILINSGYNPAQVYEASRYIQRGAMNNLEPKSDEFLRMAQNNSQINQYNKDSQKQNNFQNTKNIQTMETAQELAPETKKESSKKWIMLLIVLLFLIGILVLTIFFRDDILSYLSG